MTEFIDMHLHSSISDGKYTPSQLAEECFKMGVRYASLTDHDTAAGTEEFVSAAGKLGIHAISGVEFNTKHSSELHILGYAFDIHDKRMNEVLDCLDRERRTRAEKICAGLIKNGYLISFERVKEIAGRGVIGRPHIARALVEKGYCRNADIAFRDFLGDGGPGFVKREQMTTKQAIDLINDAGGRAVLAHPGIMKDEDYTALLTRLKAEGLFGVEVYYSQHTDEQCEYFLRLAEDLGLFPTSGTDFHGRGYNEKLPGEEKRGIDKSIKTYKKMAFGVEKTEQQVVQ